jgi:hypothetical protein
MASTPMAASESGDNQQGVSVVQTAEGPVRGFVNSGVYEFKGIPYAALRLANCGGDRPNP